MRNNDLGCFGWIIVGFILLLLLGVVIEYWYVVLIIIAAICLMVYYANHEKTVDQVQSNNSTRPKSNNTNPQPKLKINTKVVSDNVKSKTQKTTEDSSSNLATMYLEEDFSIGDLLFLNWLNGKEKDNIPPAYFVDSFSVNPLTETNRLIEKELIGDASLEMRLSKLRVKELKEILKNNNQKVSGRKLELIDRIMQTINSDIYIKSLPEVYELTTKGHELVQKYKLLIWANNNDRLTPTKEYIPYINSSEVPQVIALKLITKKLRNAINKDNKYEAFIYNQCENSLATFYSELEDFDDFVEHSICVFLLDYFLIDESYTDVYIQPREYNSSYLQTQLIKTHQKYKLTPELISNSISYFLNTYVNVLPAYVLNSSEEMSKAINNAFTLNPEEFHDERIKCLKKHIKMEQLDI